MDIKLLLVIILGIVLLLMGMVVFLNNTKKSTNRYFLLLVVSVILWMLTLNLSNMISGDLLFINRLIYVPSSLIALFTILISVHFPTEDKQRPFAQYLAVTLPTLAMCALVLSSNLIIKDIKIVTWGTDIVPGNYYFTYSIYFVAYILVAISLLINKYRKIVNPSERSGIRLFIIGLIISLGTGFATNVLSYYALGNFSLSQYGSYSVSIFIILAGYAIIRHKLFNIKLILTEIATIIVSIALLAQLFVSDSFSTRLVSATILIFVLYGGYLLIKSVKDEIKKSEQIQKLAENLEKTNSQLEDANNQLEKDKKDLVELDRMKDEFLMMATHELRTPVSAIKGRLDMAVRENLYDLNKKQMDFLEPTLAEVERLAGLTSDILNTTKIDQHRLEINANEADLSALISQIVGSLEAKAKERGNSIGYIPTSKELPKFKIDQSKISEVITNLVNNAIKFTENGKIAVTSKLKDNEVIVSVADTGIGIEKEDQKHLFQKFYQAGRFDEDEPQEQQGTGLGLYISKNIIELHGGKMWLESDKGKGSTFYFSLPLEYKEIKQPAKLHGTELTTRML